MAVFVITAGHSDSDPGAISRTGITEASVVTEARDALSAILVQRGHTVLMDGGPGVNHPLSVAQALIKRGAVAIELHTNAALNPAATGVETISLPRDKRLAQSISRGLSQALGLRLRGDGGWIDQSDSARGRLGYVGSGGLVVELFFLSNSSDYAAWVMRRCEALEAIADALEGHVRG